MATVAEGQTPITRPLARVRGLTLPQLWAFLAIALPVVFALQAPLQAGDSAYQIRAGEIMLETGSLIRTDPFTFTAGGQPWINQQWGDGVLFALIYRLGGWEALALLRSALVGLAFTFVYLACRAAGARPKLSAWLTLGAFAVSMGDLAGILSLRPQLFGVVLFALTTWLLAGRHRHPARMWLLPPVVAIWANLHASFFLVPILVGLAWIDDRHRRWPGSRQTLAVGALAVLAATLNPFGLEVWSFVVDVSTNTTVSRHLVEWLPPTVRRLPGLAFFLSVAIVVAVLARRGRPVPWPSLLSLGTFFGIALTATRGIHWWSLAAAPVLAAVLGVTASESDEEPGSRRVNTALAGAVLVLGISIFPWWDWRPSLGTSSGLLVTPPRGVMETLQRHLEPGDRIFNAQHWGSWIEFKMPQNPVFYDTRIEAFPTRIWDEYSLVSSGQESWQDVLDRWRVDAVAVAWGSQTELVPHIRRDPGWRQVYEDGEGLVFVRAPT